MKTLFILNDQPYGSERCYNALRLAISLAKRPGEEVKVFLMGDAAACARAGQKLPDGYYNLERMLQSFRGKGGEIGICGTCMDARGLDEAQLTEGAHRGTLDEVTNWTMWAHKVIVF